MVHSNGVLVWNGKGNWKMFILFTLFLLNTTYGMNNINEEIIDTGLGMAVLPNAAPPSCFTILCESTRCTRPYQAIVSLMLITYWALYMVIFHWLDLLFRVYAAMVAIVLHPPSFFIWLAYWLTLMVLYAYFYEIRLISQSFVCRGRISLFFSTEVDPYINDMNINCCTYQLRKYAWLFSRKTKSKRLRYVFALLSEPLVHALTLLDYGHPLIIFYMGTALLVITIVIELYRFLERYEVI